MKRIKPNSKFNRMEKQAAILGQVCLDRTPYQIPVSRYNSYAKRFGLPRMNHLDLEDFENELAREGEQPTPASPYKVLLGIYHHKLSLYDVLGTNETHREWDEKLHSSFTTQVEQHQLALDMKRNYNKNKRGEVRFVNKLNGAIEATAHHIKSLSPYKPAKKDNVRRNHSQQVLVMCLSDLHIGAYIKATSHGYTNRYNIQIAKHRLWAHVGRVLGLADSFHVDHIDVVDIGDNIDNNLQSNTTLREETTVSNQYAIAQNLIIRMLMTLTRHYSVKFINIAGNHDRIESNWRKALDYDSWSYVLEKTLISLNSGKDRIFRHLRVIDNLDDIYRAYVTIEGQHFMFVHGDRGVKPSSTKADTNIAKLESEQMPIDTLVFGHYHHFQDIACSGKKRELMLPSAMGFNGYSVKLNTPSSAAAQCDILVTRGQTPFVLPLDLSYIQN